MNASNRSFIADFSGYAEIQKIIRATPRKCPTPGGMTLGVMKVLFQFTGQAPDPKPGPTVVVHSRGPIAYQGNLSSWKMENFTGDMPGNKKALNT